MKWSEVIQNTSHTHAALMDTQAWHQLIYTQNFRHIHTLPGPVPLVCVNDRLLIQNKFLPCKEPQTPVRGTEMLPRMALTVYTAATTTITTLLP